MTGGVRGPRRDTPPPRASPVRAQRQETWLALVNRPATFGSLALGRRLGDVVRLPGIGRLVNDAAIARAVLADGDSFNSHDPGSFGHMITRVLGPRAFINMDGLRADLQSGRTVDFAAFMRQYGGAMACALVGVSLKPAHRHGVHEEIFQLATDLMSLAGVRRRVLPPADAARARAYPCRPEDATRA